MGGSSIYAENFRNTQVENCTRVHKATWDAENSTAALSVHVCAQRHFTKWSHM